MIAPRALPSRLRADRRGAALVEFTLVLPAMLLLYLGGVTLSDSIAHSRKVTVATRALVDMVAQSASGTTSANELDNELAATTQTLSPYPVGPAKLRISQVYTDKNYKTTVDWSRALQTTAYAPGAAFTLPAGTQVPQTYLLVAEVTYAYSPPAIIYFMKPRTLGDNLIMLPRNTSSIDCGDC